MSSGSVVVLMMSHLYENKTLNKNEEEEEEEEEELRISLMCVN